MLCLIGAAVLTLLTRTGCERRGGSQGELALVVQRIPYEAQNALRGEPSAFDALAKSVAQLKRLRGSQPDGAAAGGARIGTS